MSSDIRQTHAKSDPMVALLFCFVITQMGFDYGSLLEPLRAHLPFLDVILEADKVEVLLVGLL